MLPVHKDKGDIKKISWITSANSLISISSQKQILLI